jgi:antitoxin component of MazEF toxin-antitoxin module
MEKDEWLKVVGRIAKIGNSFSVRVPINVVKQLNAKEGTLVAMKMKRVAFEINERTIGPIVELARQCKELEMFNDEKVTLLARLMYNEGRFCIDKLGQDLSFDLESMSEHEKTEYEHKSKTLVEEYRNDVKNQFGEKVYSDYIMFRKMLEPLIENKRKN